MTDLDLAAIRDRYEAAIREVDRLCNGERWTMTVPVKDSDSDLVVSGSLEDIPKLLDQVDALTAENNRLTSTQIGLKSAGPVGGAFRLDLEAMGVRAEEVLLLFAESMSQWFTGNGGQNYVEAEISHNKTGERWLMTVAPVSKPSPHALHMHAEHERDTLAARIEAARELHQSRPNSVSALYPEPLCTCGKTFPCPTIQALEGEKQ